MMLCGVKPPSIAGRWAVKGPIYQGAHMPRVRWIRGRSPRPWPAMPRLYRRRMGPLLSRGARWYARPDRSGTTWSHKAEGPCPCGKEHAPALAGPSRPARRKIECVYQYQDLAGVVVHETIRYSPKGFGQRRPNGFGGYIYREFSKVSSPSSSSCLRLCAADLRRDVFVVEGEKDALRLMGLGQVATTNPMGGGQVASGRFVAASRAPVRDRR